MAERLSASAGLVEGRELTGNGVFTSARFSRLTKAKNNLTIIVILNTSFAEPIQQRSRDKVQAAARFRFHQEPEYELWGQPCCDSCRVHFF